MGLVLLILMRLLQSSAIETRNTHTTVEIVGTLGRLKIAMDVAKLSSWNLFLSFHTIANAENEVLFVFLILVLLGLLILLRILGLLVNLGNTVKLHYSSIESV